MNTHTLFDVDEMPVVSGKSNEWFTPARYIEAARAVMGAIDLDPASCELANRTVKATRFYTKEENGLNQPWYGKVYCNPPFTAAVSSHMPQFTWANKLLTEYQSGNVEEAILLIMACIKQKWFHTLWHMHNFPVCFNRKRIHFNRPGNTTQELRESTCFLYFGPNEGHFVEIFSQFGTIAKRVNTPAPAIQPTLWDREETA
jgi:ParB family chromosome partitioning protein